MAQRYRGFISRARQYLQQASNWALPVRQNERHDDDVPADDEHISEQRSGRSFTSLAETSIGKSLGSSEDGSVELPIQVPSQLPDVPKGMTLDELHVRFERALLAHDFALSAIKELRDKYDAQQLYAVVCQLETVEGHANPCYFIDHLCEPAACPISTFPELAIALDRGPRRFMKEFEELEGPNWVLENLRYALYRVTSKTASVRDTDRLSALVYVTIKLFNHPHNHGVDQFMENTDAVECLLRALVHVPEMVRGDIWLLLAGVCVFSVEFESEIVRAIQLFHLPERPCFRAIMAEILEGSDIEYKVSYLAFLNTFVPLLSTVERVAIHEAYLPRHVFDALAELVELYPHELFRTQFHLLSQLRETDLGAVPKKKWRKSASESKRNDLRLSVRQRLAHVEVPAFDTSTLGESIMDASCSSSSSSSPFPSPPPSVARQPPATATCTSTTSTSTSTSSSPTTPTPTPAVPTTTPTFASASSTVTTDTTDSQLPVAITAASSMVEPVSTMAIAVPVDSLPPPSTTRPAFSVDPSAVSPLAADNDLASLQTAPPPPPPSAPPPLPESMTEPSDRDPARPSMVTVRVSRIAEDRLHNTLYVNMNASSAQTLLNPQLLELYFAKARRHVPPLQTSAICTATSSSAANATTNHGSLDLAIGSSNGSASLYSSNPDMVDTSSSAVSPRPNPLSKRGPHGLVAISLTLRTIDSLGWDVELVKSVLMETNATPLPGRLLDQIDTLFPRNNTHAITSANASPSSSASRVINHTGFMSPTLHPSSPPRNELAAGNATITTPPAPALAPSAFAPAAVGTAEMGDIDRQIVFEGEQAELKAIEMAFDRSPEEQFIFEMWSIPNLRDRIDIFLLRRRMQAALETLREHLQVVENALEKLRTDARLARFLELVLATINFINNPTKKMKGMQLVTIKTLVNVKTRDRKMTLMHVLIEMVAQSTNDDLLELQPCSLDELEEAQLAVESVTTVEKQIAFDILKMTETIEHMNGSLDWLSAFQEAAAPYRQRVQAMLESMQFFGHYADLDTAVEFFDIWITFFTHFSVCLAFHRDQDRRKQVVPRLCEVQKDLVRLSPARPLAPHSRLAGSRIEGSHSLTEVVSRLVSSESTHNALRRSCSFERGSPIGAAIAASAGAASSTSRSHTPPLPQPSPPSSL